MYGASDQRHLLLANLPPSQHQIRAAIAVIVALFVAFGVTIPYVYVQLPRIDAFIPILATAIIFNDLVTSALLFSQFSIVRRRALLVLASGFLFTALMVIPWTISFPGLFAPSGLLGPGIQTTPWLYVFWHAGSPLILIVAVLLKDASSNVAVSKRSPAVAIGLSIVVVIAIVCGLTWVAMEGDTLLPKIFLDQFQSDQSTSWSYGGFFVVLNSAALALLWIRRRSVLDLWLMVMCCAWLIETVISVGLVTNRFSLGWYAGRTFGLIATFIILLVLLSETTALYAGLARSIMRQRSDRHARQITMDAMAASIVHEINQPLAAMITNANASLRWLNRETPDLSEARAAIVGIVNSGQRVDEIIGGIRSMYKKSAHGRLMLGVNDLVREVLTMSDIDLRTQRVSVTTDLRHGLPQLFGDRGQLQQVFLNLIMNAIEAMNPVTDRARLLYIRSNLVQESSDVVVTVEDSGLGIDGDGDDRIFEPFFTTKSTGIGIGLTICRVIIESHGGSLRAFANKPYGAIFQVTLPSGNL